MRFHRYGPGSTLGLTALLVGVAACASAPAVAPAPAPAAAAPSRTGPAVPSATPVVAQDSALEPPAGAVRAAANVQLTGMELGTMWTFENPPLDYWQKRYGFTATPAWLNHLRLSALRYDDICSASFVSPKGLVMTNHHCAQECIDALSTPQHDYEQEGFYAPTQDKELLCPGLYLEQLTDIKDVTAQVSAAARPGMTDEQATNAQDSARDAIERQCSAASSDTRCQVVVLFRGSQDQLYTYHRYSKVKLVFAPEMQTAYFGGDSDNFTYPRYDLDISFFRAYDDAGTAPVAPKDYLRWNPRGAKEGDVVFVVGNPGETSRLSTVAQLEYHAHFEHPFQIWVLEKQLALYQQVAKRGPEAAIHVRNEIFDVQNSIKSYRGELKGLEDTLLIAQKIAWQREFQSKIDADSALKAEYGDVFRRIAKLQQQKLEVEPRLDAYDFRFFGIASVEMQLAGELISYVEEMAKPAAQRSPQLTSQVQQQIERQLQSNIPVDQQHDIALLTQRLEFMHRWLSPDDPLRQQAFVRDQKPATAASNLIRASRLDDATFRTSILTGGMTALRSSLDPLLRMGLLMYESQDSLFARWRRIQADETAQNERLGRAVFAVYGNQLPPDGTFTLRITDGVMKGYPYNGTQAPAKTTFYGLYGRSADFDNLMPYTLPDRVLARRDSINLATPLDFVTTNDITGGNSGSPMVDKDGRLVGIAFDGNIESLPTTFVFSDSTARTVGVDASGILEALIHIYQTKPLVDEILNAAGSQP